LPAGAVLLASSDTCPVQMIRAKKNVYGIQFHAELDVPGIAVRIRIYKHHGYFEPEEEAVLLATCSKESITEPMKILQNFVERYRTPKE
jgi:GMP synthase (glutamine-hydrolysing)